MKYFERTQVSTSQRPIPQQGESFIIQQGNVGLYERKDKLDQYQDGVCYLTTHRIIYVDSTKTTERAVALPLSMVKDIETFNGFLRASPKIILHLQAADRSTSSSIITSTATTAPSSLQQSWVCTICSFSNPPTTVEKCQLCGVRRPQDTPSTTTTDTSDQQQKDSSACRVCTFLNHPSMIQCEMCGASLANPSLSNHSSISDMLHTSQQQQQPLEDDAHVRIAFRNGGLSGFLSKLKEAVDVKAWNNKPVESPIEKPASPITRGVGISAIQGRIEKTTMEAQESMDEAFQDLDKLMAKATEMVSLAESISTKMNKESNNNGDDLSALRTTLLNLGISDPVTRGSAGSIYHQELARELADFLSKFLDRQDTVKPLTDLYCVFNRARGVAFISPEDLYKAAMQFEVLQLPFRMRQFPSGLLVVQSLYMDDERAAQRVLDRIKEQGGHITSLRLAELENYALAVATEHLMIAEQKALVCRDQGPNGLTFYENLLLTS
ncbi:Vps36-domain-containing protein [Lichtheimia hyalospora FSU 10163]|nr:Vps36-domain-containing protein [Lichtheimia hyalospora FSU 10163]